MRRKKFLPGPLFGEGVEKNSGLGNLPRKDTLERAEDWVEKGFLESDTKFYDTGISRWRLATIYIIFLLVFVSLFARVFELQIIEGDNFLGQAEENRYRVKVTHAPRGVIYDRNGVVLARNTPSFNVSLDSLSISEEEKSSIFKKISKILNITTSE